MTDSPSQAASAKPDAPPSLPPLDELSRRIRDGEMTPAALVERCLGRVEQREDDLRAWAYLAAAEARQRAGALTEELKATGPRGALHGIPFGVKDIFDTAGMPTEWGSALYAGRTPGEDCALVAQLAEAGGIVLGKTVTTAFAYFDAGPTRNPRNLEHTPGGSSSGSAAAVADGMLPFALGSQTMGSVLRPASFCGVVGFKPTFGRLALEGVMPFSKSLDHAGCFTRTVEEMSFLWQALGNEVVPSKNGARTLTVVPWPIGSPLEAEMAAAFAALKDRLAGAGFAIERIGLPPAFEKLAEATRTVMTYQGARTHEQPFREHGPKVGAKLAVLVEKGLAIGEAEYRESQRIIQTARADFAERTRQGAVWLTPAAPGPAPEGLGSTGDPICNLPFTALGVPAISVPFGHTEKGLPLGLQLSAAADSEGLLLATALRCEQALAEAA